MKPVVHLSDLHRMKKLLRKVKLNTVCEESRCPNISECFSSGTATFMILGDRCTRSCSFCNVKRAVKGYIDPEEPFRIAEAVRILGLDYVVITSVTRDDLALGGAFQFFKTVRIVKELNPGVRVEVLVPDFGGSSGAVELVMSSSPDVFSHNIETVPRLYGKVRRGADYGRSLCIIKRAKEINPSVVTKSALLVGFGERIDEIKRVMDDLRGVDCDVLTIGQYYMPSLRHHPVVKYYREEEFLMLKEMAEEKGFKMVVAGPNVRSSYKASMLEGIL